MITKALCVRPPWGSFDESDLILGAAAQRAETAEEQALHDVWMEKLQLLGGAHEAVRFAGIQLRDAMEAERAACAALRAVLDASREEQGGAA